MAGVNTSSETWAAVRHYCRSRMRELERDGMSRPDLEPSEHHHLRGQWAALSRLVDDLGPQAGNEGVDRADLNEETFEP